MWQGKKGKKMKELPFVQGMSDFTTPPLNKKYKKSYADKK